MAIRPMKSLRTYKEGETEPFALLDAQRPFLAALNFRPLTVLRLVVVVVFVAVYALVVAVLSHRTSGRGLITPGGGLVVSCLYNLTLCYTVLACDWYCVICLYNMHGFYFA
jgi:hypothetical protein